jgi:hypothetical protein
VSRVGRVYEAWLEKGLVPFLWPVVALIATWVPLVTGGILYLTHRGHPGAIWWLVGGLAITLLVVASYGLRWRLNHGRLAGSHQLAMESLKANHAAELAARDAISISTPHLEQIKRIAKSVAESIKAGKRCDYADPKSSLVSPNFRTALTIHCREVARSLIDWDRAVEAWEQAVSLMEAKVHQEVMATFPEPWMTPAVEQIVLSVLRHQAEDPTSDPVALSIRRDTMAPDPGYASYGNTIVYYKQVLTDEEIEGLEAKLSLSLLVLEDLPQVHLLEAASRGRTLAHDPALIAALGVNDRHSLPRMEGCPLC